MVNKVKASFSKRLCAFLIDVMIVTLIYSSIMLLIPKNHNLLVLDSELTSLNEQYLKEELDMSIYWNRYATILIQMDRENVPRIIINLLLLLSYFVLLPYYWDGKTIGKKLMKLKIVKSDPKEKISMNDYLIRTLVVNGIASCLILLSMVYLLTELQYLTATIICSFVQILLVIISSFMIIYRKDKKGVQDFISGTQVVIEG